MKQTHFSVLVVSFTAAMAAFFAVPNEPPLWIALALLLLAAALVTGVRGMIAPDTRRAFRHSGLAHMLAISGLHMALFAGSVYALIRLLAAL